MTHTSRDAQRFQAALLAIRVLLGTTSLCRGCEGGISPHHACGSAPGVSFGAAPDPHAAPPFHQRSTPLCIRQQDSLDIPAIGRRKLMRKPNFCFGNNSTSAALALAMADWGGGPAAPQRQPRGGPAVGVSRELEAGFTRHRMANPR